MSLRARWRRLRATIGPPRHRYLERAVGDAGSVLDVGCGDESPLAAFRDRFERLVGVDGHAPTLERARGKGTHTDFRLMDVLDIEAEFGPRSFDVVAAVDLLEHLNDEDGLRLLGAMERVARRRVVVFTPNGFLPQGEIAGNPLQVHRSGWTARRMRALGYDVTGVNGLRWLRGGEATIRFRPRRFWSLVSDLTQPLAERVPGVAFHLLCVKDV